MHSQPTDKGTWQKQPVVKSERYGMPQFDEDDNVPLDTNAGAKLGGDKKQRQKKDEDSIKR